MSTSIRRAVQVRRGAHKWQRDRSAEYRDGLAHLTPVNSWLPARRIPRLSRCTDEFTAALSFGASGNLRDNQLFDPKQSTKRR